MIFVCDQKSYAHELDFSDTYSFVHVKINSWSRGKLISWELTWWEVDLVGVDLVGVDFVRVDLVGGG